MLIKKRNGIKHIASIIGLGDIPTSEVDMLQDNRGMGIANVLGLHALEV
jgi:hypothetical protein